MTARPLAAAAIALAIAAAGLAATARAAARAEDPADRVFTATIRKGSGFVWPDRHTWFAPNEPLPLARYLPVGK